MPRFSSRLRSWFTSTRRGALLHLWLPTRRKNLHTGDTPCLVPWEGDGGDGGVSVPLPVP